MIIRSPERAAARRRQMLVGDRWSLTVVRVVGSVSSPRTLSVNRFYTGVNSQALIRTYNNELVAGPRSLPIQTTVRPFVCLSVRATVSETTLSTD